MSHWTERFFLEHPELFLPALEDSVEGAEEQANEILTLLDVLYDFRPESVLDVGCGIGRHVTAFAECGIEAHGLDMAATYTDRASERAEAAGVADLTTFFARDMREVGDLDERYDLVMNIYSFGFFDEATNERLLGAFYERLRPGGVLLIKTFNKVGRLLDFTESGTNNVGDVTYVREYQYDPLTSRRRSEGFVIENENYLGDFEFDVRLYTPIELAKLVSTVGFEDVFQFETYDREELTRQSEEQVILGRR